ncbi:uncharacterized protein BDR25DRAFT_360726 [Lindgomyces ingoldianus]|uniref:Uncharacterized protein n=1 Tax=Lindgomyces ingoldianus TaxID=673940 RepID=A0ACB6QFK3_9PLEO|nr:uncharacterized protein BDR25DRAFT_360726 [Lindgomyces ingoldianus]KAF2465368.1 hypothetical protein BDR25DRAFT_360726 [Lindgomyces ingoldianus]
MEKGGLGVLGQAEGSRDRFWIGLGRSLSKSRSLDEEKAPIMEDDVRSCMKPIFVIERVLSAHTELYPRSIVRREELEEGWRRVPNEGGMKNQNIHQSAPPLPPARPSSSPSLAIPGEKLVPSDNFRPLRTGVQFERRKHADEAALNQPSPLSPSQPHSPVPNSLKAPFSPQPVHPSPRAEVLQNRRTGLAGKVSCSVGTPSWPPLAPRIRQTYLAKMCKAHEGSMRFVATARPTFHAFLQYLT